MDALLLDIGSLRTNNIKQKEERDTLVGGLKRDMRVVRKSIAMKSLQQPRPKQDPTV